MTIDELLAYTDRFFNYDPATGIIEWKELPRFQSKSLKVAGYINSDGYIQIKVNKKCFLAHRLAWLIMTREIPALEIDHINRIRTDNRWANLRLSNDAAMIQWTGTYRPKAGDLIWASPPLPSKEGAEGWQPIETAPKDGTYLLLIVEGYIPAVGYYDNEHSAWVPNVDDGIPDDYEFGGYCPTHWMRLPGSPTEKGE